MKKLFFAIAFVAISLNFASAQEKNTAYVEINGSAKVKVIPDMGNLSSAENRVRLAEISFKQAHTDFERIKRLYNEKVISTEEYEKAEVSFKQAQLEKNNAEDALNIVRDGMSLSNANMSTTLIRSTIDGLILDIPVKVGTLITSPGPCPIPPK